VCHGGSNQGRQSEHSSAAMAKGQSATHKQKKKRELGGGLRELTQRRKKIGKGRDSKSSEKQEERRTEAKKRGENRLSHKETDREDCKR